MLSLSTPIFCIAIPGYRLVSIVVAVDIIVHLSDMFRTRGVFRTMKVCDAVIVVNEMKNVVIVVVFVVRHPLYAWNCVALHAEDVGNALRHII
jgi:hypothetical protein